MTDDTVLQRTKRPAGHLLLVASRGSMDDRRRRSPQRRFRPIALKRLPSTLSRRGACTGAGEAVEASGGVTGVGLGSDGGPDDSTGVPPPGGTVEADGPEGSGNASKGDVDSGPDPRTSPLSAGAVGTDGDGEGEGRTGGGAGAGAGVGAGARRAAVSDPGRAGDSSPSPGGFRLGAVPGSAGAGVSEAPFGFDGPGAGRGFSSSNGDRVPPGIGGNCSGLGTAGPLPPAAARARRRERGGADPLGHHLPRAAPLPPAAARHA